MSKPCLKLQKKKFQFEAKSSIQSFIANLQSHHMRYTSIFSKSSTKSSIIRLKLLWIKIGFLHLDADYVFWNSIYGLNYGFFSVSLPQKHLLQNLFHEKWILV